MPNGKLRTSVAQRYTMCFCKRLSRDFKAYLYPHRKDEAYPADEEEESDNERAAEDPYGELPPDTTPGETIEEAVNRTLEENRARRKDAARGMPAPVTPVALPKSAIPRKPITEKSQPSSSKSLMKKAIDDWDKEDEEEEELIRDLEQVDSTARASTDPPPAPPSEEVAQIPEGPDRAAPPAPLALSEPRIDKNRNRLIEEITVVVKDRISNGSSYRIQTGPRLRNLQELFGTPHGKVIVLAAIYKKPASRVPPEPIVSRSVATHFLELLKPTAKSSEWKVSKWQPWENQVYTKRPYLSVLLYGRDHSEADTMLDLKNSPWSELALASADAKLPLDNLPGFLKTFQNGSDDEKRELILALHRRLYHKPAPELRLVLQRAGVPLSVLSTVSSAIEHCDTCRAWARGHAKPVVKIRVAPRFNFCVYGDLVFFTSFTAAILVDESLRITALVVIDSKNEDVCEQVVRRHWINRYGPPKIFRGDFA